ncbi:MAG: acetate--CoA ligase family protein [Deltaproteobacteria bacterium]|nr:acetate--CoA ligase family protein [Deltaproteobacteria bacterium]
MDEKVLAVLQSAKKDGWVMEPQAKALLRLYGLPTTRFFWGKSLEECRQGAQDVGYPLVAKVVSPEIMHKADVGGVVVGVADDRQLTEIYKRMARLKGFMVCFWIRWLKVSS